MDHTNCDDDLAKLDLALSVEPKNVDLLCGRAALLASGGRTREAQADYLTAIKLDPDHFGALNDLGVLLHRTDFRTAARTVYAEAVRRHPQNAIGRINLGNALLAADDLEGARIQFEAALKIDPEHPDAHQGMANLLQDLGETHAAEMHRNASYRRRAPSVSRSTGRAPACHVLHLVSAAGGNIPTRFLLDPAAFAVTTLVVEAYERGAPLPDHDVVFNAVGDADFSSVALVKAEIIAATTRKGVINRPEVVLATGRAANARRLGGAGVRAPRMILTPRREVKAAAAAFGYPLLVRAPGFHTGRHFVRVETPDGLAAATTPIPGEALLLIEPLTSGAQPFRKYRVMVVGGRLFPLHLAIGKDWKVHYFTADMAERRDYREVEATFLADMSAHLGPRAMEGLADIVAVLGLDYAGIDFGLGSDGEVLLFEANATMVVNPPPQEAMWDYRRSAVQSIFDAVKDLILARAGLVWAYQAPKGAEQEMR